MIVAVAQMVAQITFCFEFSPSVLLVLSLLLGLVDFCMLRRRWPCAPPPAAAPLPCRRRCGGHGVVAGWPPGVGCCRRGACFLVA